MVREIGYAWVACWVWLGLCVMFLFTVDHEGNFTFTGKPYITRLRLTVCMVIMLIVIWNFFDAVVSLQGKFILHG